MSEMPSAETAAWAPRVGTTEDDLRSRLACILETTYWDRPYETRIAAIRGMCDLATNGMTPTPEGSLAVEWGVRYPSGAVESYGDDEAAARRYALATTSLRPDLPTLVVRQVVTPWECPTPTERTER